MAEKKNGKSAPKKTPSMKKGATRPKMMKDGSVKWGGKTFANEKEFTDYLMKTTLFIDGAKTKKK